MYDPTYSPAESLEAQQARYSQAISTVFDVEGIKLGSIARPGELQANIFESEDGLRLIVSRDRLEDGEVQLHVSASLNPTSRLYRDVHARRLSPTAFCRLVVQRWQQISGRSETLILVGFSEEKGVPHFILPEEAVHARP